MRPHRWQPTRLPHPWDSPGKNTGVGCHFLLQCMIVKSESEVAQSSPTLSNSMDCSPPGSSIHEIFQARVLKWFAIPFYSGPRFVRTILHDLSSLSDPTQHDHSFNELEKAVVHVIKLVSLLSLWFSVCLPSHGEG